MKKLVYDGEHYLAPTRHTGWNIWVARVRSETYISTDIEHDEWRGSGDHVQLGLRMLEVFAIAKL